MTKLRKTGTVLEFDGVKKGYAKFVADDVEGDIHTRVRFPEADWLDMGEPTQVTVTIEPGNALQIREVEPDPSEPESRPEQEGTPLVAGTPSDGMGPAQGSPSAAGSVVSVTEGAQIAPGLRVGKGWTPTTHQTYPHPPVSQNRPPRQGNPSVHIGGAV